ncbi:DUF4625 domain-containing protein [Flavobacterium sp. JP2137]|uniref:DUF4625 domain-containing protein n=1 Tax=Flavobacterium sp. JP2137 TaxID=3414510 RepID=UPI003D2FD4C9
MKTLKTAYILALGAIFSLSSCSSDDNNVDTQKPKIDLVAPKEGAVLPAGKDVHFDMEVSDNVMLASYKVEIHNNFDNHNHSTALSAKADGELVAFTFNRVWSLEGQKNADVHHHDIVIPANAKRGNYHFIVYVLDKAGNEEKVARNIVIGEPQEPGSPEDNHDHDHAH